MLNSRADDDDDDDDASNRLMLSRAQCRKDEGIGFGASVNALFTKYSSKENNSISAEKINNNLRKRELEPLTHPEKKKNIRGAEG